MKKNWKILAAILFILVLAFALYQWKLKPKQPALADKISGTALTFEDSVSQRLLVNSIFLEPLGAKQVVYRVDNNSPNPTYIKFGNYRDTILSSGSNFIYMSPITSWNGMDSLITTVLIYSTDTNDDIIATSTKTERIICPQGAYFNKLQNTTIYTRKKGPTEIYYMPVIGTSNVVTWPPTYK